jgi:hypothetical protein
VMKFACIVSIDSWIYHSIILHLPNGSLLEILYQLHVLVLRTLGTPLIDFILAPPEASPARWRWRQLSGPNKLRPRRGPKASCPKMSLLANLGKGIGIGRSLLARLVRLRTDSGRGKESLSILLRRGG